MKAIGKKAVEEQQKLIDRLHETYSAVGDALQHYNDMAASLWDAVETATQAHNEVVQEAKGWVDDQVVDMEAYRDERSETWHDSGPGRAYADWIAAYQAVELEEMDLERPETVELETYDPGDDLASLEDAPF